MRRKIEDILIGNSPDQDLENEKEEGARKLGKRILMMLRIVKTSDIAPQTRSELWKRIEETTNRTIYLRRARIYQISAVACVLLIFTGVWLTRDREDSSYKMLLKSAESRQNLLAQEDNVIVSREDGRQILVRDGQERIDLSSVDRGGGAKVFNTLTVPYGKRIEVILPDNSKVWLNAGSQLTFPTVFDEDERRVYLQGEGYFDVQGDVSRPFYLHTEEMVVKVLGTTFNVSAYKEDKFASTVLLTGEIELQSSGETKFETQILKPGTAAVLRKDIKRLSISKEMVENYVSWTQKQLILKNTPLPEILIRLQRVYNTDITLEVSAIEEETFSGRLDLTQPLTSLLATLYSPAEYQLQKEERRIKITKR